MAGPRPVLTVVSPLSASLARPAEFRQRPISSTEAVAMLMAGLQGEAITAAHLSKLTESTKHTKAHHLQVQQESPT